MAAEDQNAKLMQHFEDEKALAPKIEELLADHLMKCSCEHWEVQHTHIFMRATCSVDSARAGVGVLAKGAIICLGCSGRAGHPDWVRCAKDAKFWRSADLVHPVPVFTPGQDPKEGFLLVSTAKFGDLIRYVDGRKHSIAIRAASEDQLKKHSAEMEGNVFEQEAVSLQCEQGAPESTSISDPPPICGRDIDQSNIKSVSLPVWSNVDHWIVEGTGDLSVHQTCSFTSYVELLCRPGDAIVLGPRPPRLRHDINLWWLHLDIGTKIYRGGKTLLGDGNGFYRSAFIPAHSDIKIFIRNKLPRAAIVVHELSGYGEPWTVAHEQVVVRREASTDATLWGIMVKNDVAGVRRRMGKWVELMPNFDVRMRKAASDPDDDKVSCWSPVAIKVINVGDAGNEEEPTLAGEVSSVAESQVGGWMLQEHPTLGQLLRPCKKFNGGLERCVITKERVRIYRDVVNVCHKRIFEENLEELWEGDVEKMPTVKSIEAKLFDANTKVIHVEVGGQFAGGAILKEFAVKASSSINSLTLISMSCLDDTDLDTGRSMVGYIDCCAAEPSMRAGSVLWKRITMMPCICVACHSILLQSTVDFWQSRGMKRMDPTVDADCLAFSQSIMVATAGRALVKLSDVVQALPQSKLPLFVWVNASANIDPTCDFVFSPCEPGDDRVKLSPF